MTVDLPVASLVGLDCRFVPPPARVRSARVLSVRSGPKGPLFSLEGVDDITTADTLRGTTVLIRAEDLPDLDEEFDPVGLQMIDETRGPIGEVRDVIVTGANDVWVIEGGRFGQVLVPVIDDVIVDVDEDAGTVTVRLLPGLIEE